MGKKNGFTPIEEAARCMLETEEVEMAEKKILEGFIPLSHEAIKHLQTMDGNNTKINEIKK